MSKEELMEMIKKCPTCPEANGCFVRPIMLYINDIGLEYFLWQKENGRLPKQIADILDLSINFITFNF